MAIISLIVSWISSSLFSNIIHTPEVTTWLQKQVLHSEKAGFGAGCHLRTILLHPCLYLSNLKITVKNVKKLSEILKLDTLQQQHLQ